MLARFDEDTGNIQWRLHGMSQMFAAVDPQKKDEARRLAQELHGTFSKCDYMTKDQVSRLENLAPPP